MQYTIVTYTRKASETIEDAKIQMAISVEGYLSVGWKLCGGLTVDKGTFYQAVTNTEANMANQGEQKN